MNKEALETWINLKSERNCFDCKYGQDAIAAGFLWEPSFDNVRYPSCHKLHAGEVCRVNRFSDWEYNE